MGKRLEDSWRRLGPTVSRHSGHRACVEYDGAYRWYDDNNEEVPQACADVGLVELDAERNHERVQLCFLTWNARGFGLDDAAKTTGVACLNQISRPFDAA